MKKKILITGITITALCISILGWKMTSYSQQDNKFYAECLGNSCCMAYNEGFDAIKNAWQNNMQQAIDQEKPTSDKIDDVFEGYNTYKCWAEYICGAVLFSGFGSPDTALSGLTKKHIGTIPGCQDPEDLEMPDTWPGYVNTLKDEWEFTVNSSDNTSGVIAPSVFTASSIPFIPQCMTDKESLNKNLQSSDYETAGYNYDECMAVFKSNFGCGDEEDCESPEVALTIVETALKQDNADQKVSALENKLASIIQRMHSMQLQTEYLKNKIISLDSLYGDCYPAKCD